MTCLFLLIRIDRVSAVFWLQVYVWVLNDEDDFKRAFDLGATGVMTDFPTRLKNFIENNDLSRSK